ncbi:MAG: GNAT family N-acetyltransferase [Chloroflexota bacterium]
MLKIIDQKNDTDYVQQFKMAVRHMFPILCFTPEQTEAFIDESESQFDDNSGVFEDKQGQLTFYRYKQIRSETRNIQYIIPSDWEDRYSLVKQTLIHLKQDFLNDNTIHSLRMRVDEGLPSHNAYYAGTLADLGFKLRPRLKMTASHELPGQLDLTDLAEGFKEMSFNPGLLTTSVDIYGRAHLTNAPKNVTAEEIAEEQAWERRYLTDMFALERTAQTWVGLGYQDHLIGFAFGGVWGNELALEEVVLAPEFHGQGVGRYLVVRFLQKMAETFKGADTHFSLGTDRTNTQALKLYHRLGFKIDKIESYAEFSDPQLS